MIGARRVIGRMAVLTGLFLIAGFARAQDEMPKDQEASHGKVKPPVQAIPAAPESDPSAVPAGTMIDQPMAILQGLDKVTARVRRLPIKVGQTVAFGTLSVSVQACRKAPPEDPPEAAAFLRITEQKGDAPQTVFSGWMFASSPALSAMDHAVYDIWVVDCAALSSAQ